MALGGGTFTSQNKILPGTYSNVVSAARATSALSERGIAALAAELDWGKNNEVITIHSKDFATNSLQTLGYESTHKKLKGIRDVLKNAKTLYLYKLNSDGTKAENIYGKAICEGIRGNDLKLVIQKNIDNETNFDVITLLGTTKVDTQTVASAANLIDNAFVEFRKDATLAVTAGLPLESGDNGQHATGEAHQTFLDKMESYAFHVLGCLSTDDTIKQLYASFTRRMRDEMGIHFQLVAHKLAANFIGCINLKNHTIDPDWPESSAVYWTVGAEAGCGINATIQNKKYDGEFIIDAYYKQNQLEEAILAGEFVFHKVGDELRVLDDINSFVTFTENLNSDFASNQTVRVIDQDANDTAVLFNTKYLGNIPNDQAGRISFWNDLVKMAEDMHSIRAIENFDSGDIVIEKGNDKKSVIVTKSLEPVNCMSKLYVTTTVR